MPKAEVRKPVAVSRGLANSGVLFPITPALSLGERERRRPFHFVARRDMMLPLLGESMWLAARGHSCPQPFPNANMARICCLFPQNTLLRTGMSARRATRIPGGGMGRGGTARSEE